MLTTIEGTYKNGVVILNEAPPSTKDSKVLVTFAGEIEMEKALELKDVSKIFDDCRVSLKNYTFNRDQANDYND